MQKYDGFDFMGVDGLLSDEEKMVRDSVRAFVEEQALPKFTEHYENGTFPTEIIPTLGELGVFGATIKGYGCAGISNVAYGLMMQELERGDSGLRSFASVQSGLVMFPINAYGSEEQKSHWLPKLAKAEARPARALSFQGAFKRSAFPRRQVAFAAFQPVCPVRSRMTFL